MNYKKVQYSFKYENIVFTEEEKQKIENLSVFFFCKYNQNKIYLESKLADGGQGTVYSIRGNDNIVAKIYNLDSIDNIKEKKLDYLVNHPINSENICWPIDTLYYKNKFVGFIMPKVKGKCISKLIQNASNVEKYYKDYNKKIQIDQILNILHSFELLHNNNIIVGDIKLENIMFEKENFNITLVDMDSVQVDQFPCNEYTPGYQDPDIMLYFGKDKLFEKYPDGIDEKYYFSHFYSHYYRNIENELFSLAVLLFRILLCNCQPYNYMDLGEESDDDEELEYIKLCVEHRFIFDAFSDSKNDNIFNRYQWSYLPSFLKEAFAKVFSENTVIDVEMWIKMFKKYRNLLENKRVKNKGFYNLFPPNIQQDELKNQIADFSDVQFDLSTTLEKKGFALTHAIIKLCKEVKDKKLYSINDRSEFDNITKNIKSIAQTLKQDKEYIYNDYHFRLIYNIGVVKKIELIKS